MIMHVLGAVDQVTDDACVVGNWIMIRGLKNAVTGAVLSWSFTTVAVAAKNVMTSVPDYHPIETACAELCDWPIRLMRFGGTEVMRINEAEPPRPGEEEVLIRVAAAGANRADLHQRQGHYPPPPGASDILGQEVAGEIVGRGTGTEERWNIGDKVCALVPGDGYAEYCVAHYGCCCRPRE